MDILKLFKLGKPAFYITPVSASQFHSIYLYLTDRNGGAAIRMIRGKKSKTTGDFYNEIGAVLQFPYYFGENGAALNDCINDLAWLVKDFYLLMIDDAHLLLSDTRPMDIISYMTIFSNANTRWVEPNKYSPRNRQPTPFHVLFRCDESDMSAFLQRLGDFADQVEVILLSDYIDEVVRRAREEYLSQVLKQSMHSSN